MSADPTDDKPSANKEPPVKIVDRRWWARSDSGAPAAGDSSSTKPTYVEDLEQRLAEITAELHASAAERRALGEEFDQARARLRRTSEQDAERARRTVLVEMLDVVDNLDRALAAVHDVGRDGADEGVARLAQGVDMVRIQILEKLERFGVLRVGALGQPFDAARHEAVGMAPVTDTSQDGAVVAVLKEGYAIGDEILRAASVIVGHRRGEGA